VGGVDHAEIRVLVEAVWRIGDETWVEAFLRPDPTDRGVIAQDGEVNSGRDSKVGLCRGEARPGCADDDYSGGHDFDSRVWISIT